MPRWRISFSCLNLLFSAKLGNYSHNAKKCKQKKWRPQSVLGLLLLLVITKNAETTTSFAVNASHLGTNAKINWEIFADIRKIITIFAEQYTPNAHHGIKRFEITGHRSIAYEPAQSISKGHRLFRTKGQTKQKKKEQFKENTFYVYQIMALAKFKHPTHQIIFCNDKALATLKYVEHYEIKTKQWATSIFPTKK